MTCSIVAKQHADLRDASPVSASVGSYALRLSALRTASFHSQPKRSASATVDTTTEPPGRRAAGRMMGNVSSLQLLQQRNVLTVLYTTEGYVQSRLAAGPLGRWAAGQLLLYIASMQARARCSVNPLRIDPAEHGTCPGCERDRISDYSITRCPQLPAASCQ
ncbi:hypothetical protein CALCODRAFT_28475 [Calocera cornea HHB12733]|uniref:Uncharacterized protein n=1 Tax=Calocera cornea HHB12733 TaxID=1353952 RepID=A0A165E392_9BASI|nr:hypothetical protein CALCODRAFT_28475 [Calocera cornea HHB12733]